MISMITHVGSIVTMIVIVIMIMIIIVANTYAHMGLFLFESNYSLLGVVLKGNQKGATPICPGMGGNPYF